MSPYCAEKNSHKHFCMLFSPKQGGTSINESQSEDTGKKSQDVLFSENRFCSLSVWHLLCLTPWVFWSEFFTDIGHCVYWVLAEVWAPDSFQKIGNKLFFLSLPGLKGRFVSVWNFLIFFVAGYSSVLTWNLSCFVLNSVEILGWNFRKKLFRDNFPKIWCKPRLSSTETCEILA